MQEQYLYRKYNKERTAHYKKRRKKHNFRKSIIFVVSLALIVAFIICFLILYLAKNENKLVGTWVYDQYTCYVFEESDHGKLLVDNISYEYTYKVEGEKLIIDFTEDVIRDCDYTFLVDGPKLTLKGGNGTDGRTYTLNKK